MSATIPENRAMDCALHAHPHSMGPGGHRTPRARRRAVSIRGIGCSRGHRTPRTGLLGGRRSGHHAVRTRRRGLRLARTDVGAAIGGRRGLRLARTDVAAAAGGRRGLRLARTDVAAAAGGRSGPRLARADIGAAAGGRSGLRLARADLGAAAGGRSGLRMARTDVAAAAGGSRGPRLARADVAAAAGWRSGLRLARADIGAAGGRSRPRMARTVRWRLGSRGPWWRRRLHARTAGRTQRRRGVWSMRGAAWTAVVVVVVVSAIVFSAAVVPSVIVNEYASSHAQCQADCKDCHRYSLHIASLQGIVVLRGGNRGTAANLFALHHIIRRRDDSFQRRRDYKGDYHAVAT